ncbi:MAG: hypothetical protein AMJ46_02170 [Latescibacteria bacterium DG_63]|nr:MAG: hypothetical protein AMJ46_02170 [Latescibacteria bacterium DG_63]
MVGKTISHYRILEKLGEGGMGMVYKAEDTKLKRTVALKFLASQALGTDEEKARFLHEAQTAAALNHPNICTIHEIDEADGQTFIGMECVEGLSLKEKVSSGPLKLDEAVGIAAQVAEGLQRAHQKGVVHRDIKPANIMVTGEGAAKIMDFGLAKLAGRAKVTKTGTTIGTIAYMSPEQASGHGVDHRSDIWSLGVVFYEMLTGELPFKSDYEAALIYSIINEEPLEPSQLDRKISPQLDAIIMKMLEKDLEQRYASVEEFIKDVQDFRKGLESKERDMKTKVIAVLPFNNISPEKESDYFSDGLTEELIINLSRLKVMKVVSRTTSMQYKGTRKNVKTIGRELDARYILEGSVRKFQDNLRITAQLVDVKSDTQLWAETFSGKLADVFDIQEEVSKQIVNALMLTLTPTEKVVLTKRSTENPEAFDCCQRAREFLLQFNKNKLKIAIQLFEKAIELDARYANAYAGLAEAYATLYQIFERQDIWLEKSVEAGLKALMYDSSLSQAYSALSLCYFNKQSLDEALEASQKAIELDPTDHVAYWILGRIHHLTDQDREAIELYKKVIELSPDFYSGYADLLISYERLGEKDRCAEMLQASLEVYPRYVMKHPDDGRAHMFFAIHLARAKKIEEAKSAAEKALELNPTDPLMLYNAACFYAQIGEKNLAVESLKSSIAAGHEDYEWFKRDPDLSSIRNEPEYMKLMEGR